MAKYWRISSIVIGLIMATPSHAQPSTTDRTCIAAVKISASKAQSVVATIDTTACVRASRMSGFEMALCLALLGCMILTGGQASRRKAIKVVAS